MGRIAWQAPGQGMAQGVTWGAGSADKARYAQVATGGSTGRWTCFGGTL
jgi:hypothetical protein